MKKDIRDAGSEVLLVTVSDENEANIVQALLKSNDIPSMRKHRGNGDYLQIYMGMSYLGVDIFVMENQYEEAKALLAGEFNDVSAEQGGTTDNGLDEVEDVIGNEEDEQDDETGDLYKENYSTVRTNRMLMLFLIFIVIYFIIMIILSAQS